MNTLLVWVKRESHIVMKWGFIDEIEKYCLVLFDKGRRLSHLKANDPFGPHRAMCLTDCNDGLRASWL